jgi:hypothetical protein
MNARPGIRGTAFACTICAMDSIVPGSRAFTSYDPPPGVGMPYRTRGEIVWRDMQTPFSSATKGAKDADTNAMAVAVKSTIEPFRAMI